MYITLALEVKIIQHVYFVDDLGGRVLITFDQSKKEGLNQQVI